MKDQTLLKYVRRYVNEYDLIQEGDRIAVGVSGGKDSLALLYALSRLRSFSPVRFSLAAVAVDPGFSMDYSEVRAFSESLGVPFILEKTEISRIVFEERKESRPCALCANLRRGALVNAAVREGLNKLALGHHREDLLSTLMMNLIYEGRFYSYAPVTVYEDRGITLIRPLLNTPESLIRQVASERSFPVLANLCPADGKTRREDMEQLNKEMSGRFPGFKDRLYHAIQASDIPDWVSARNHKAREAGSFPDVEETD